MKRLDDWSRAHTGRLLGKQYAFEQVVKHWCEAAAIGKIMGIAARSGYWSVTKIESDRFKITHQKYEHI